VPEDLFRPQLGAPHHYGYVVEAIEETVSRLVDQLGAGPFFLVERVPLENVLSRGEPADFIHNSAFGFCGGGPIELMEIINVSPERVEKGFSVTRPGIHHVAYAVPRTEVADLRSSLDQRGLPQYLSAELGETENTFHDASALLGTTSRSTSTVRRCAISSAWSAAEPTAGTARNRYAESRADCACNASIIPTIPRKAMS